MEEIVGELSGQLGPKWVLLITKLKLLKGGRARYNIEARYLESKEPKSVIFKHCAQDCIKEWMMTEAISKLEDIDKIKRLLLEMYKVEELKVLVQRINPVYFEAIGLPGIFFNTAQTPEMVVRKHKPVLMEESPEAGYSINESRTRSAFPENSQAQESWSKPSVVTPLVSQAGPSMLLSPWPYGESDISTPHVMVPMVKPEIVVTPNTSGLEGASWLKPKWPQPSSKKHVTANTFQETDSMPSLARRFREPHVESRSSNVAHSLPLQGIATAKKVSGNHGRIGLERRGNDLSSEGGSSTNSSSDDTATVESPRKIKDLSAFDVAINIKTKRRHQYAILDVSQRLPEEKWEEIGSILGLERDFLEKVSNEEVEERYYLMLKKWVELSNGVATFSHLREILANLEADVALLILEARLDSDRDVLLKAIEHDL